MKKVFIALSIMLFAGIFVMAGTHVARCDVLVDVKIMPKKIKIGEIRTFKAKVGFPKEYDLRSWTITSMTCGDA